MGSAGDWGDIIDEVEAERFVGREQELESFSKQINPAKLRYLVFYITGQGGAGKSTLLHRYQSIAEEHGFLVAECDEQQRDVPAVLGRFAQQLIERGAQLNKFSKRYEDYRQKMHEIESDPEAPQGLAATFARTMVRAAFIAGDAVPGMRRGLDYLPREAVETQASEWATYLARKLSNKDDVALVREPIAILTPLFFEDLNKIAERQKVLLCFDNFEATRPELQGWLLRLRDYRPSPNIRIAIAGRDAPGAQWDLLQRITQTIHIDVFSEQEAEAFLDANNISNPKRRREILELSGRLPVLMSWLAAAGQGEEGDATLPTHDIVERFLRWITDPALREVALLASIPRAFNVDILETLLQGQEPAIDEQAAFDWLQTMPFVQQSGDTWRYHEVVRRMMLRYQRQKSPHMYRQRHAALADFYNASRYELSGANTAPEDEQWTSEEWQKDTLAYVYHYLAANPHKHWEEILSLFVIAIRKRRAFASGMIELQNLEDVRDELTHTQIEMVELCHQQLTAIREGDLEDGFEMFDRLCDVEGLSSQAKGYAFAYRGDYYRLTRAWEKALSDFGKALQYNSNDEWALAGRGQTYYQMARYQEALDDFNSAVALDRGYEFAIAYRGATYKHMKHYQEALADFNKSISLNPKDAWNFSQRGETYRLLGRYQEALDDFDHAIALDEQYDSAYARRGETYRLMGRYQEALADFDRAIALDENYTWALANRGETYRRLERYQEALADFDRAIALDENYTWAIACRGKTYQEMDRYQEALTDFDRAIALDEKYSSVFGSRGRTYRLMGNCQHALEDLTRAIELDKNYAWAFAERGETYRLMGRYQEALDDFDRATALDENDAWAIAHRGQTYRLMELYQEALDDFDHAISLDEKNAWHFAERGETYRLMNRYEEALTDFDHAISLDENYAWAIGSRGQTYRHLGRYEKALTDFNRTISLDEKSAWIFKERGETYRVMKQYQEALTDFDRAIALDEKYRSAFAGRGQTYRQMGCYQDALTDLSHAIELDKNYAWAFAQRGLTYRQMGHYEEALADLNHAIELGYERDWVVNEKVSIYVLTGRYEAALDFADRDIAKNEKDDWNWFGRAIIYLLSGQINSFENDIQHAIELAGVTLDINPEDWRAAFNLAIYNLVSGNLAIAESQYTQLILTCSSFKDLGNAEEDLRDLLEFLPSNELAKRIRTKLQARIAELQQVPSIQQEEPIP